MTFNPLVPNAAQSPGLFPPQNGTNFTRLKAIIEREHVFNDTATMPPNTDGIHKQVTMVAHPEAVPGDIPPGANSMLYTDIDSLSRAQLYFYNGAIITQLTPPEELYPIRIVGSASLAPLGTAVAYANPGFLWAGTGWAINENTSTFRFYNLLRSGTDNVHELDTNGTLRPTLSFSSNNLIITNPTSGNIIAVWSLIINRIS